MSNNSSKGIKYFLVSSILFLIITIIFFTFFFLGAINSTKEDTSTREMDKTFHILIIGNNENELFLKQVYEGAINYNALYNTVVELYVPQSHAEDIYTQSLFEYASFVNADGIIAYINNSEEEIEPVKKIDGTSIPIVTIGQFAANINQITYVGGSYWELGRVFGNEIISNIPKGGIALIQNPTNIANINYSNLTNSLLATIRNKEDFSYQICNSIDSQLLKDTKENDIILVGLTEEDTIKMAQLYTDAKNNKNLSVIGFGNNETCQMYLSKGTIKELISQDPKKVGEAAVRELYEYRNKGYANSYVISEVKVARGIK